MIKLNAPSNLRIATWGGLATSIFLGAFTLMFSLDKNWTRTRFLAMLALYAFAIALLEFGDGGRWFPKFSAFNSVRVAAVRISVGIAGFSLLLAAVGFCFAWGSADWKVTSVGLMFGMCVTSYRLIRMAITGIWSTGQIKEDNIYDNKPVGRAPSKAPRVGQTRPSSQRP